MAYTFGKNQIIMTHKKFRVDLAESGFEIRERAVSQDKDLLAMSEILGEDYINAGRLFDGPKTVITWPISGVSVFSKSDEPHSKIGDAVELRFDALSESPTSIDLFVAGQEIAHFHKSPKDIWTQILRGLAKASGGSISPDRSRQSFKTNSGLWVCDYSEPPTDLADAAHHIFIHLFLRSLSGEPKQHFDFQFTSGSLSLLFLHFDKKEEAEKTVESISRVAPTTSTSANSLTWSQAFFKGLWEYFGRLGGELLITTVKVALAIAIVTGAILAAWFFLT